MTKTRYNMDPLDLLASTISKYYNGLPEIFDELTVSKVRDIQNQIRTSKYTLSSLQFIVNQNKENLKGFNHILHLIHNDSILYGSFSPIQEDQLVLMALGGMLNTRMKDLNLLSSSSFGLQFRATDYYAHIRSIDGPISRVYKLDMTNSLRLIDKGILLTKLEPIVSNDDLFKLLKSFLYIPIIYEGNDYSTIIDLIPPSALITEVLLNFSLIELDNQFLQLFPSFSYTRYVQEVIVTTSQIEPMFESSLFSLFDRLNLGGKILSIGPGEKPMLCYHGGVISITEDGRLSLM